MIGLVSILLIGTDEYRQEFSYTAGISEPVKLVSNTHVSASIWFVFRGG